ncbi:MAG TPA: HlyD family efflux transporter periplasmic adaptor subunit [Rhodocyclaceae bacterium]|nr:HlyD family efflux transporter periplasmic adaptor subunit [Rhodocyclaceae bacterium]
MPNKKRLGFALAAVAIVAALIWALLPKAVEVDTAVVARGDFEQTIDDDGKTRVRDRYVVSAPLAGRLQRISLKAGDPVAEGMGVAVIAPALSPFLDARSRNELAERLGTAQAARLRAEAHVERAQAALEQAAAEAVRARALAEKNYVSKHQAEQAELAEKLNRKELDAARFEAHAAEHDVAQARAALARVDGGAAATVGAAHRWAIRSPVPGRVLRVFQESEAVVAVGTPLLEIGQPDSLEVVVDVLSTDAVQIRPGMTAYLERWGRGEPLAGRVRRVEPAAFTKVSALGVEEQRVNVLIDLVSPQSEWQTLGDGYKVDARIVVAHLENALKIPLGALFRDGDNWAVFVVEGGRAVVRKVVVANRNSREAVVSRGLAAGERVIAYPSDAVKAGVRVKPR